MREVAAALGNSVEPLPEGLWSQIASQLPEREADGEPPPMPDLSPEDRTPSPFRASADARSRRRRPALAMAGAVAVAAAAVAVVLGIGLVRADNRASNLQAQMATEPGTVAHALATPGRRVVSLDSASHGQVAQFVVLPDGRGYLVSSALPTLAPSRTYQLWGVVGSRSVSLGLLGSAPKGAVFTMAGTNRPTSLAITSEPAGGAVADHTDRGLGCPLSTALLLGSLLMPEDAPKKPKPIEVYAEAEPVKLGSMLLTLVEPHRGHEVAYNRWYERDHFYAGCMVGAYTFAGRRYVATSDLKALRDPDPSVITGEPDRGSYIAAYWVLDGYFDVWNKWALRQVNALHAAGRMFQSATTCTRCSTPSPGSTVVTPTASPSSWHSTTPTADS